MRNGLWWRDKFYAVKRGLSAEASRQQVGEILRDMEHEGRVVGHCSLTLLVHDPNPAVGRGIVRLRDQGLRDP